MAPMCHANSHVRRITGRCGLRVGVSNAASHGKYQRHKQAVHAKTKHGVIEDQTFSLISDKSQHVRIGLVKRHRMWMNELFATVCHRPLDQLDEIFAAPAAVIDLHVEWQQCILTRGEGDGEA